MKLYQSHKVVSAAKILDFTDVLNSSDFALTLEGSEPFVVSGDWVVKHNPDIENLIGGYFVQYADGYTSWSPAEAFETGYTEVPCQPQPEPTKLLDDTELAEALDKSPAPRVTKEYMESRILNTGFLQISPTVIVCQIELDNGYSVRGESACVSPENFNAQIGETNAFKNAFDKLWPLFGFLLAESLHQARHPGFEKVMETAEQVVAEPDTHTHAHQ